MNSDNVNRLLFDYEGLTKQQIVDICIGLPKKLLRWLGENHPDNRTRIIFFELTGVHIGESTVINKNLIISDDYLPLLFIGNRVAISPNVTIICSSGPNNSKLEEIEYVREKLIVQKEIHIKDDVWIGTNVTILPDVEIGECSIIAANSLINKNVPARVIVAGSPAKIIKYI
jgi:maltose O-acetyltransferase